jgi:hypothetical protein
VQPLGGVFACVALADLVEHCLRDQAQRCVDRL